MNTIVLTCKASNNRLETLEDRLNNGRKGEHLRL